jgi:glycosyltransferase involved in cell wall biosynthesis
MELIYLANVRLPTEKAHGLQIMKMCEAFAQAGATVELVIPRRVNTPQMQRVEDLWTYYDIKIPFTLTSLSCLDWPWLVRLGLEPLWFRLIVASFSLAALRFLIHQRRRQREFVLYTRDEHLTPWLLRFKRCLGLRVFFEAHTTHGLWWAQRFRNVDGLITITYGLKQEFVEAGMPPERCLVAPDGVDLSRFSQLPERLQARGLLHLPAERPIVCYTGHLFPWKGVHTLVESAGLLPEVQFVIVGGMPEDVEALRRFAADHHVTNVQLVGHVPPTQVPLYLAAADVLVLPNSAREEISAHYTSPMKLFEYMAAGRPIVASDLPSLREVLTHNRNAILVKPDDPHALADGLRHLLSSPPLAACLATTAREAVSSYTWQARAQNLLAFIAEQIR